MYVCMYVCSKSEVYFRIYFVWNLFTIRPLTNSISSSCIYYVCMYVQYIFINNNKFSCAGGCGDDRSGYKRLLHGAAPERRGVHRRAVLLRICVAGRLSRGEGLAALPVQPDRLAVRQCAVGGHSDRGDLPSSSHGASKLVGV